MGFNSGFKGLTTTVKTKNLHSGYVMQGQVCTTALYLRRRNTVHDSNSYFRDQLVKLQVAALVLLHCKCREEWQLQSPQVKWYI